MPYGSHGVPYALYPIGATHSETETCPDGKSEIEIK